MTVPANDTTEHAGEDFDLENLTPEQQQKFLEAIKSGATEVELDGVTPPPTPPAEPPPPAVEPATPVTPETPVEPVPTETPKAKARPQNYQEAMDQLNTARQKLEAREKLLRKIGEDPEFAVTYLQERGHKVTYGQDAVALARQIESVENANSVATDKLQRDAQEATRVALSLVDTELVSYDTGLTESLSEADAKWAAVWEELGRDETKIKQYLEDAEFRKTVKAQGPSDPKRFMQVATAVRAWMSDPNRKPLAKHLDFHDVPRKATAPSPATKPTVNPAFEEAKRLEQIAGEPRTLPSATVQRGVNEVQGIEELLEKADAYGTDNLTPDERARIKEFYTTNA